MNKSVSAQLFKMFVGVATGLTCVGGAVAIFIQSGYQVTAGPAFAVMAALLAFSVAFGD
jgi:hypothetical protein